MTAEAIFFMNKIFKEVNDINENYMYSCRKFVDNEMKKMNTDLVTFLQEEVDLCKLYLMIHNYVYNFMSDNQVNIFITRYGIQNAMRHRLDTLKMIRNVDEDVVYTQETLDTISSFVFCNEIDNLMKIENESADGKKEFPRILVTTILHKSIKDDPVKICNEICDTNQTISPPVITAPVTSDTLMSLGPDIISLIYDELRCENNDYIEKFNIFFSKQFKGCKCSKQDNEVLHTDACHAKVIDIVFSYVKKMTENDINQNLIKTGIGKAIEIFYVYNKTRGQKSPYEIGNRIRSNMKWRGISWNIETEMMFLILMYEIEDRYNY